MTLKFIFLNIWIWLIIDHKLAIEDKFVKLVPTDIKVIAPIKTWLAVLSNFAVSDTEVSCWMGWIGWMGWVGWIDGIFGKYQFPKLKLYPVLQVAQIEESVIVHIWQFPTVHLLTVRLIIFWTGLDTPEIVDKI